MEITKLKPIVGITAFLLVLFTMPLGHSLMIVMEKIFGHAYQYYAATLLGLLGFIMVFIGVKQKKELLATWLGFFGGILIWTGWVEFSFVFFAQHLNIPPQMENGEIVTKPEYLLMPSSIGLLFASFLYFFFNKESRCNFIRWCHRNFHINLGKQTSARDRKYAAITATETIFVLWVFYILMMIAYDPVIFGDHHPVTYILLFGSLLWSLYLFLRLIKIAKMAFAVRYAIPTVIIFWTAVEIFGRWGFFTEIWVHPGEYALELGLLLAALIGVAVLTLLTSKDRPPEPT